MACIGVSKSGLPGHAWALPCQHAHRPFSPTLPGSGSQDHRRDTRAGPPKTVGFDFNMDEDTAASVSAEMVEEMSLDLDDAAAIALAIASEIAALTSQPSPSGNGLAATHSPAHSSRQPRSPRISLDVPRYCICPWMMGQMSEAAKLAGMVWPVSLVLHGRLLHGNARPELA